MELSPNPALHLRSTQRADPVAFRIIIPAHNEEAVIARCLNAIFEQPEAIERAEIMVVANGCSDQTAEIARSFGERVRVLETSIASKSGAINMGLEENRAQPCLVVDADVICNSHTLHAVAEALQQPGIAAASPALKICADRASAIVRAYYRVWQALPYASERLIGGGVYGISASAIDRIAPLPKVIADDLYVRTQIAFANRRTVSSCEGEQIGVTMFPPESAWELVKIEARRQRGTQQIKRLVNDQREIAGNGPGSLVQGLGKAYGVAELLAYAAVKLAGRILAKAQTVLGHTKWSRDLSTRSDK